MLLKSRWLLVSLLPLAAGSLAACHKDAPAKANQVVIKTNPEELARKAEAAKQSLEGLKPQLSALNATLAELHREFDPLPPGLPGFGETRGKFYTTAEGLGTMNASLSWLSGRIDSAVKSGNGAELDAISKDITQKYDEVRHVDRITLELREEVRPFKTKVEDSLVSGKSSCE